MRFEGVLQSWNDERGFGFVAADVGGEPVFVHIKAFGPGAVRPQLQQRISFEVEPGAPGKKRASKAWEVQAQRPRTSASPSGSPRKPAPSARPHTGGVLLLIPALAVLLVVLGVLFTSTKLAALWYAILSAVTYLAYAHDKSAAQKGAWRTSEKTLLSLGLVGGWPGALLAQQYLRHKSSKRSFLSAFWFSVLVNVAWLCYRYSPLGMHVQLPFA